MATNATANVPSYTTAPFGRTTTSETKPTVSPTLTAKYDLILSLLAQATPLAESLSNRAFTRSASDATDVNHDVDFKSKSTTSLQSRGSEDPVISEINEIVTRCRKRITELKRDVAMHAALQLDVAMCAAWQLDDDSGSGAVSLSTGGGGDDTDVQMGKEYVEKIEKKVRGIEVMVQLRRFFEQTFWANQEKGKGGQELEEEKEEGQKEERKKQEEQKEEEKKEGNVSNIDEGAGEEDDYDEDEDDDYEPDEEDSEDDEDEDDDGDDGNDDDEEYEEGEEKEEY